MSDSTQNIDLIERYFDNELTEDEQVKFQERLKSDLKLKHLFDREKLLVNTIRFGAAKNHLEFFKELEKSLPEVTEENHSSSVKYYAAAASVVVLIVAGIYLFRSSSSPATELYAENFRPFPNLFEPTVRGTAEQTKRALAFQKYEEGDYQQAADLFTEILQTKQDAGMLLLLGNANLSLERVAKAKENFNAVIESSQDLVAPAQWYLSLCYLKEGDTQAAKETLITLASGQSDYAGRAKDLLKRLAQ